MNGTDISIDERIRSFAASVRQHLDDLPEDELDEILSGLTADLADQAADDGGVLELGDPRAYAHELRSAAGLPPRADAPTRPPLRERVALWRTNLAHRIRRSSFGAWLLDFLIAVRPVWWVLRAYSAYVIALAVMLFGRGRQDDWMLPSSPLEWAALLVFVVVSVQWGRDRWLPKNLLRHLRTLVSIAAVIALPFALGSLLSPRIEYVGDGYPPDGLRLDGIQIGNIFAFDENGDPIEHVQLYTGKGTPLNLYGASGSSMEVGQMSDDGETVAIPFRDYRDQPVWNVFPLDEGTLDPNTGEPRKSGIRQPSPPFQRAPGIVATAPTPTPTPVPTDAVTDPATDPTATPTP